jgi:hypothetical protein
MIRLSYDPQMPLLAVVAQDGNDISICVNQYAQMLLNFEQRKTLFNDLMRAVEGNPGRRIHVDIQGINGPNIVIHLADARQRRQVAHALAEGVESNQLSGDRHGMDPNPGQRSSTGCLSGR